MAAASAKDTEVPLKRRSSFEFLPPNMSELRVVLLGNSWSEKSSVGNLLLEGTVFNTEEEPNHCLRVSGQIKEKKIVLINTPDLLNPNISEDKLRGHVGDCVRLSGPGPHVFLLVLQPEDFTDEHKLRICRVLERFSDQSFDRSLVLISASREESPGLIENYLQHPLLGDIISRCGQKLLWQKNVEHSDLLSIMDTIVEQNDGDDESWDVCEDAESEFTCSHGNQKPEDPGRAGALKSVWHSATSWGSRLISYIPGTASSLESQSSQASEFRIVLLGKSEDKKTKLGNFIIRDRVFDVQKSIQHCVAVCGKWRGKCVTVVKTPDLFSFPDQTVREEMKRCINLSFPGPNVLLLLVKPSEFKEKDKEKLKFILSLFGEDAFKHSMVIMTQNEDKQNQSLKKLLQDCRQKQHSFNPDNKDPSGHDVQELMQKMEAIVSDLRGEYLTLTEEEDQTVMKKSKPPVNLVLCGRRGAGKTSAVNAILGQKKFGRPGDSSECVRTQGEVCGRRVSLLELPALYGKSQEAVMEESFRCISLCDPEGVHAFILVLPVGLLTDEDKGELETIQNTFSSKVRDFILILFTVESDPTAPEVVDFIQSRDIQELCQSCGGRSVVVNMKDKQQIPELLDQVDKMTDEGSRCFTKNMFTEAQMEKVVELTVQLQRSEVENPSRETLRMVLIGRSGSGKSATANTILGKNHFKPKIAPKPSTKSCEKGTGEPDGRPVAVVNTPALLDEMLSDDEFQQEILKSISLLPPGPHVFLLVLQIGTFMQKEKDCVELIKRCFGKKSQDFIFIIFTRGDELEDQLFENYLGNCQGFAKLIQDCGGRYQVFNNKDPTNRTQVKKLLNNIDVMVEKNGGSCFTSEMIDDTKELLEVQLERIQKEKEDEMKKKEENLRRKHQEDLKVLQMKHREQTEQDRKLREKQLKEKDECINRERELRKKEREEDEKRRWKEENQKQEWRRKAEAAEKKLQSEREQRENTEKKLELTRREMKKEMKKERDAWDKERKETWERMHQEDREVLEEERTRHRKLQEEFYRKRKIWMYSFIGLLLLFLLYYVFLK